MSIAWERQYKDDPTDINGSFIGGDTPGEFAFATQALDDNYFAGQVGITAAFTGGVTSYLTYDTYIDRNDLSSDNYSLGIRWQF